MINPYCTFRNPRQVCEAVSSIAEPLFDKQLVKRPWNMYEPNTTLWWITPTTDWPAYKHGKNNFQFKNDEQAILSGLNIEKGLGLETTQAYSSPKGRRMIMDNTWIWHHYIDSLRDKTFESMLVSATKRCPIPLIFEVSGSYVPYPDEYDPYSTIHGDFYIFSWQSSSKRILIVDKKEDAGVLRPIDGVKDLSDLSSALSKLNENQWLWIDIIIGIKLDVIPEKKEKDMENTWSETDLWQNLLSFFRPWVI